LRYFSRGGCAFGFDWWNRPEYFVSHLRCWRDKQHTNRSLGRNDSEHFLSDMHYERIVDWNDGPNRRDGTRGWNLHIGNGNC